MNFKQLVDTVLDTHPQVARGHAASVLREALRVLHAELSATEEGKVLVPGLGVFSVRQAQVEKDGVSTAVRRTGFRLSPLREVTEGDAGVEAVAPVGKRKAA